MATKTVKQTTLVNGVPHTTTVARATVGATSPSAPATSSSTSSAPARGQAGWIDPIRAPGDTKYTDQFGTPTDAAVADASTAPQGAPQAPVVSSTGAGVPNVQPAGPSAVEAPQAPVITPAASPTPTQNKYQQGLAAAQATGAPAPTDAGQARSAVSTYTPPSPADTTNADAFLSQDPGINTLMQGITQLLNPKNQTSTLMQDYTKLRKQSGLDKINEELIDADTVINGTEDDIRNEIQTAGGMGTESQVQAMTLARNKGLLTRYNQLVQMKTDATNQLNTMMSLNQQDKQMAQEKINSQVSAMFNMANFRQQALNNTRSQYQWLAEQQGADGLYNSLAQDPRQLAFAEQILGTGPGGLQKIAQQASKDRATKEAMNSLDIQAKRASIANSYSEIAARNAPPAQTPVQVQIQGYADRTNQSDSIISKLGSKFASASAIGGNKLFGLIGLPNALKSSDRQQYEQAQRDFVNSVLRRESGAAIGKDEFDSASKQYFPQPGDSQEVVAQKSANRQTVVNNLYDQSGSTRSTLPGQLVQGNDGKMYQVAADGVKLLLLANSLRP